MAKKRKTKRKTRSVKKSKTVGIFDQPKPKRSYKRRKVRGRTELRRYKTGDNKGEVKSVSMIIYNKRKGHDALERFADDISRDRDFIPKLNRIYYRNRRGGVTILPFSAVVIVEQRNRDAPSDYHYEPYFMAPPATKQNIRNHTINTVRNHGEFIRRRIVKMGYKDVKYDFENFNPWFVPSIRIELLYR